MNILPIIERLADQCPDMVLDMTSNLQTVERERYPTLTVGPGDEIAQDDETLSTEVLQQIRSDVHVYVAAPMATRATGIDPLADALTDIRAALMGYLHADWDMPLTLISGSARIIDSGRVLWRDTYTTQRTLVASITS